MINIIDYGFIPNNAVLENTTAELHSAHIPARVTASHKDRYEVVCEYGQIYARLKTSVYYGKNDENFPTTGDFVLINYITHGDSFIVKTLERTSKFARADFAGHDSEYAKTQVVATNFDYVFIMSSLNHEFNLGRIERYLVIAKQSGGVPILLLTKADLVEDFSKQVIEAENIAAGVKVYAVSAKNGFGIEALSEYLKPRKTIVFLGSSGVGKSSLVNALVGEDIMAVNEIREGDSKGRHTTTHRQLITLKNGVMIIDTPGMRELPMIDISDNLSGTFADVEQFLGKCKYSNCKHQSEPDCAVKAGLKSGELPHKRWDSYLRLYNESKSTKKRKAPNIINKDKKRGGKYDRHEEHYE